MARSGLSWASGEERSGSVGILMRSPIQNCASWPRTVCNRGVDITELSSSTLAAWRADTLGYVFQLYNLVPTLTAYENVELPLFLHSHSRRQRHDKVALALELVGLADRHDHFPRQLSGGQEQRVAIARAIVADPRIIVADEPTGDLDATAADGILELLGRLNEEIGKTLIMVTHDPKTAERAHRVLHLEKGALVDAPEAAAAR